MIQHRGKKQGKEGAFYRDLSSFKINLLRQGAWTSFGKVIASLGTLIGVRLLTEVVSKEVYGIVSLLLGLMTLGSNLFVAPFMLTAQRLHSEKALAGEVARLRYTTVGILRWTVITLVVIILTGGAFYSRYNSMSYLVFPVLSAFLVVQVMRILETTLFVAARRQKEAAIWDMAEAWAMPALAILTVLLVGVCPESILFGYLIAAGGILFCFFLLPVKGEGKDTTKKIYPPDKRLMKDIWNYAIPLIPLAIVGWINTLSDRYIIGGLLGTGEVGIYAATYGLIGTPFLIVGSTINQTLRPLYFQTVSAGSKVLEKKILFVWITITVIVCAFGVMAIYYLRYWIARLLLAEEYRSGTVLMPWIAAGIGFQVIAQVFEGLLFAYKRTRIILLIHSIGAVVCLLSVYLMLKQYGLIGAAQACPIYYFTMVILGMLLVQRLRLTSQ